jgi:drug/metabolite transporter (DMT)-like permease
MEMSVKPVSILIAILAVCLMASVPVVVKAVSASEIEVGTVRLLIAGCGMTLWLTLTGRFKKLTTHQWLMLILLGLIFALHWYAYFKSIKLSSPSIAAIGVSTYGLHLIFLGRIFLQQPIAKLDGLALMMALLGIYLVFPQIDWRSSYFQGLLVSILSGFLYACLPIIHRLSRDISNSLRAWGQFTFGLALFAPWALVESWQLSSKDWMGLIFLGLVSTLLAHSLWVKATTELPAAVSSMVYYLYVPLAMLLSYFGIGEDITLPMIIGAGLIIIANVLTVAVRFFGVHQRAN